MSDGETVVPDAEVTYDHAATPTDPGTMTVGYCATCGDLCVMGLGGWQHAPKNTSPRA